MQIAAVMHTCTVLALLAGPLAACAADTPIFVGSVLGYNVGSAGMSPPLTPTPPPP